MGVNDREQDRKVAKAQQRAASTKRRANTSASGERPDWSSVDGIVIAKAVAAIASGGGALRLGYTRDGGAFAIGFYENGETWTEYVPVSDGIEQFLRGVIEDYGKG